MVALGIVAALVVIGLLVLSASVRILREYERGVVFRLGRLIALRGPGPPLPDPDRRPDGPRRPADGDAERPAAGGHHQGQRHRPRQRRRLLPGDRSRQGDHRGRELPRRHLADRADDPALGARQGRARLAAGGARAAQPGAADDHRRADRAVGHQGLDGRGQGRRAAPGHAAGDRPAGAGRARAAREDHRLRGRVPGRPEARRRRRHHQPEPGDAAAPLPADAAADRASTRTRRSSSRCRST